ncbi:hypothetical protein JJD41_10375 [Oxynema sp. CENA135]|jgi:hypothetical protein|uniref:Uncharacterized protein n=1 Tax=Oxynema aestuarii AP17 TaxID=2064643 RepID=A0A6H1U199_9CYAN|nr:MULTISPECIES: hypothetical protein [Oxynema]MBK4730264.1 hypothetical protein [Oxynema sp. CENA135]QIZ72157.1 hypothetical protein HCG48_17585 [Oxynema aestuarii AP17]RMH72198.1 MAG: hypothetical protein D6680_19760 [Cyanobacteria bacterium J007]
MSFGFARDRIIDQLNPWLKLRKFLHAVKMGVAPRALTAASEGFRDRQLFWLTLLLISIVP